MSSRYYQLNAYQRLGKICISRQAFEDIATLAATSLKDVSVEKRANGLFNLTKPAKAVFRKDGKVEINIEVSLRKGVDVAAVCLKIQEAIASAISMMAEAVPLSIAVHVGRFK